MKYFYLHDGPGLGSLVLLPSLLFVGGLLLKHAVEILRVPLPLWGRRAARGRHSLPGPAEEGVRRRRPEPQNRAGAADSDTQQG